MYRPLSQLLKGNSHSCLHLVLKSADKISLRPSPFVQPPRGQTLSAFSGHHAGLIAHILRKCQLWRRFISHLIYHPSNAWPRCQIGLCEAQIGLVRCHKTFVLLWTIVRTSTHSSYSWHCHYMSLSTGDEFKWVSSTSGEYEWLLLAFLM